MKFKRNLLILSAILIGVLIVVIGCQPITPPIVANVPSNGTISIAHGAAATNDATPPLTISATGADHMAFSGNGTIWSSWVVYATSHSTFNITTGAGCTTGDGTKTVYVKFKNDAGESTKVYDSIVLDTAAPALSTAVYTDVDSSGTVNSGDRVVFTFNDEMLTSTVTSTNVATSLLLSAGSYGTGPTVSWNTTGTICTVALGTSPTIVFGTTVNPASSVTDTAGNADNSSAITISGLLNVLASVSITPATAIGTVGTAMSQSFTASALSTVGTTMTSSCTFTWSISPTTGRGSLSSTSGTTATYTLPATGVTAGTATIMVTAVKTGTTTPTKTDTSTITVGTTTPPTPTVDPAKLFVSLQTGKAKYTALPAGATSVTVYSDATKDPVAAVTGGVTATIILNDWWTAIAGVAANEYIYFMITYSDGTTSPVTYDGQLPDVPNAAALAKIQATSKNTVTSTAGGNVGATDKISLYVGAVRYSEPTPLGTMTTAKNLADTNVPLYTRTNANGHESAVSGADGTIVQINTAVYADNNAVTPLDGKVDPGDTITITYSGNVTVTAVPISFSLGGTIITANLTSTAANNAVLTITGGPYDLSAQATVNFNLANKNIVDNVVPPGGGNWAFKHASGIIWTPKTHF